MDFLTLRRHEIRTFEHYGHGLPYATTNMQRGVYVKHTIHHTHECGIFLKQNLVLWWIWIYLDTHIHLKIRDN
jgi:hypothetical protein